MGLHLDSPRGNPAAADDDIVSGKLRLLLLLGMYVLIIGMAVLPAGVSYNPGKLYQRLLALTLYLPALLLLLWRPRRWLVLWRQPLMPWVIVLLTWASVSLSWSNVHRPADELGRNLSIVLFLFGWSQALSRYPDRIRQLLIGCALAFVPVALLAILLQLFHPDPADDGRLTGFGVMDNATLAAAAMGAAIIWLSLWPWRAFNYRIMHAAAWCVLGLFVLLTHTRSAWGALFVALLVLLLSRNGRRVWPYAAGLVLLGVVGVAINLHELTQRGWSQRPALLWQSWELFSRHPWLGLGQGSAFEIHIDKDRFVHAHNLFSQLAIELGVPGLLIWSFIWLALAWRGWCHRREPLGQLVLVSWVFATIMVQFDLPHLLDSPRPDWLIIWLPLAASFSLGQRTPVQSALAHST